VRPHGLLRGRPQGREGRQDAMVALSYVPFCPCEGRQVSLWYLSAVCRYTARFIRRIQVHDHLRQNPQNCILYSNRYTLICIFFFL